jgi:hypothetical protein
MIRGAPDGRCAIARSGRTVHDLRTGAFLNCIERRPVGPAPRRNLLRLLARS